MLALIVVGRAVSVAQRFGVFEGAGIRVSPSDFNDGGLTICKLTRLSELTKVHASRNGGDVNYWVVRLTGDQLFECPMLLGSASWWR